MREELEGRRARPELPEEAQSARKKGKEWRGGKEEMDGKREEQDIGNK